MISGTFYIIHLLDFPCKKANLHLALLNIVGECAMLSLCTYGLIWGRLILQ